MLQSLARSLKHWEEVWDGLGFGLRAHWIWPIKHLLVSLILAFMFPLSALSRAVYHGKHIVFSETI